ncbi:MAG: CRISPR-associated endonuclease Cas1 [Acidobacteria bacterium]|nr:CRISPR-associated endonuclease Cas1 [Acidobacteriota bacterium]
MGTLFDKATSLTTLARAFERVSANAGGPGSDGVTIDEFDALLDASLAALHSDLRDGSYRAKPLVRIEVRKRGGGRRPLAIPCVRDRVAQTAAGMVLSPLFEQEFEDSSFGYRVGRSVAAAVDRVLYLRERGYLWVVDADIRSYFDEVPHDRLLALLHDKVADDQLVALIKTWLQQDVLDKGRRVRIDRGVPQGSPISPLLANLYLDAFDEHCERKGLRLVRYADDFLLLCRNRAAAERALEITEDALARLRLALNDQKTRVTSFQHGFTYLGTTFLRSMAFRSQLRDDDTSSIDKDTVRPSPSASSSPPPARAVTTPGRNPHSHRGDLPSTAPRQVRPATADKPDTAIGEALATALANPQPTTTDDDEPPPTAFHDPLLRTLFALTPETEIRKDGEQFIATHRGRRVRAVPSLHVDQVVVFGGTRMTMSALRFCLDRDIAVHFVSRSGRYQGALAPPIERHVALQRQQLARSDDPAFRLRVAQQVVAAKLANCRNLLLRKARRGSEAAATAADRLLSRQASLEAATTLDEVRGLEGAGAASYYEAWTSMVERPFAFSTRRRRPPPDPVNSLLSFGYSMLYANAVSLLHVVGLHPAIGFLHDTRDGHATLASDLMEELRAPVVDRTVLALLARRQVTPDDFVTDSGAAPACRLTDGARKTVLRAFELALNRPVRHPDAGERCDYRRVLALQARRMAAVIAGERDGYEPFVLK